MRELTITEIETVVGGSGPVIIDDIFSAGSGPVIIDDIFSAGSGPVIIDD